jgi:hypothetical protein
MLPMRLFRCYITTQVPNLGGVTWRSGLFKYIKYQAPDTSANHHASRMEDTTKLKFGIKKGS